jgi:hypothetical protein
MNQLSSWGMTDASICEHLPFHARAVARAPASPGVYLLYRRHRLIYIGLAAAGETIRDHLRSHLSGQRGSCTQSATEFNYEAAQDAVSLYRHYLAVNYGATGGLLPDCNEPYLSVPTYRA